MIRKSYLIVFFIILISVLISARAFSGDFPEPISWISDYAGVLTDSQKTELNGILQQHENATTSQLVVSIMKNIPQGYTLDDYVNELFSHWKPGQKEKDNGVLLAIFIDDRKLRIEVGYGLEDKLTDAHSKLIIVNEIVPAFKEGNYYAGIKNGISGIIAATEGSYKADIREKEPEIGFWASIFLLIIKFFILYLIVVIPFKILGWLLKKAGFTLSSSGSRSWSSSSGSSSWSNSGSSSWSSSGSSSWSSSSSSSSFSGGGGSSGGGGASGSW